MACRPERRYPYCNSKEAPFSELVDETRADAASLVEVVSGSTTRTLRAWFLRMLRWGAGASNADMITSLMSDIGLRQSRRLVEAQGEWLAAREYLVIKQLEMATVYELTRLGDEVAKGVVVAEEVAAILLAAASDDDKLIASIRSR